MISLVGISTLGSRLEIADRRDGGSGAVARNGGDEGDRAFADVSCGEQAGTRGSHHGVGLDVACAIERDEALQE